LMRLCIYIPEAKYTLIIRSLAKLYSNTALIINADAVIENAGSLAVLFSIPERKIYDHILNFLLQKQDLEVKNFTTNLFKQIIRQEGISVDSITRRQPQNTG